MTIVSFYFDRQRDIENIWKAANLKSKLCDFSKKIDSTLLKICSGIIFEESKPKVEAFNSKIYESSLIRSFPHILDSAWDRIEPEFIERLEKITKKRFNRNRILGLITTVPKCPYSPKEGWFMVSLFNSIPGCMMTAGHELFHIHIHDHFFEELKNSLGDEKAHDIKEAITTVLLNLEFKDLWIVEDSGYEKHSGLRKFIEEEWLKTRDFKIVLDKCIKKLKD